MRHENTFELPADSKPAWKIRLDVARAAPCLPTGKHVEVVDEITLQGRARLTVALIPLIHLDRVRTAPARGKIHRAAPRTNGIDADVNRQRSHLGALQARLTDDATPERVSNFRTPSKRVKSRCVYNRTISQGVTVA